MSVTLRPGAAVRRHTYTDTCPASREVLRGELSQCWRQCAGTGVTLCKAGLAHQLLRGSGTNWPSSFNVSVYIRRRYTCITDVYYVYLRCKHIFDAACCFTDLNVFSQITRECTQWVSESELSRHWEEITTTLTMRLATGQYNVTEKDNEKWTLGKDLPREILWRDFNRRSWSEMEAAMYNVQVLFCVTVI